MPTFLPGTRSPAAIARLMGWVVLALLGMRVDACAEEPEVYALDPVHTRVMFAIEHAGFSKAIGTVSGSTGRLVFDPENWSSAHIEVEVPLSRLDLGDARWNRAALAGNLLDVEDHPVARFVSTRVEALAPDRASVFGTLRLHGVSRDIVLDVRLNALKRHPLPPFRLTAGFSATTSISRKAFGIDAWPRVIGDAVELRIEAEAVRARSGADAAAPETAPSAAEPASGPASDPAPDEPEEDDRTSPVSEAESASPPATASESEPGATVAPVAASHSPLRDLDTAP